MFCYCLRETTIRNSKRKGRLDQSHWEDGAAIHQDGGMKEEMVVKKMRIWLETHSLNFADLIIFILGFGDRVSHSPGWLQTCYLGEDDLECCDLH